MVRFFNVLKRRRRETRVVILMVSMYALFQAILAFNEKFYPLTNAVGPPYQKPHVFVKTLMEMPSAVKEKSAVGYIYKKPHFSVKTLTEMPSAVKETSAVGPIYKKPLCNKALMERPSVVKESECVSCGSVTCQNMLFGKGTEELYAKAKSWMKEHPRKFLSDLDVAYLAGDCESFKKLHRYYMEPLDEEEAKFPIAYNIIMHKETSQVERLLRIIYRPQNVYCIHVDAKSSKKVHDAMQAIAKCFPNVNIASKLERIVYAGFSRLQADINCMKDLVAGPSKWKYLINLAGQSFPLKTNSEIVQILKIYNGANDIEGIYGPRVIKSRFEDEWLEAGIDTDHPTMKKTGARNPAPPYGIHIVRGSAYGIFSRAFVEFILTDEKAKELLRWSRKTWSPDEHYWATLHHTYSNPQLKTPGGFSGFPSKKDWLAVYAAWGGEYKCQGIWKRGTCIFGVGDLPTLPARKELFANKFYQDFDPLALDCLENWIEFKTICPTELDLKYYKSLPFILENQKSNISNNNSNNNI